MKLLEDNFKLFTFISLIISLFMLCVAPTIFEYNFCRNVVLFSSVVSFIFLFIISKQEGVCNFHSFFIFSFFCINYVHAIFVYPNDYLFPSLSRFDYSIAIIPYSLAVAQVGLMSYMLGVSLLYKKNLCFSYPIKNNNYKICDNIAIVVSILLFFYVFFIYNMAGFHLYPRLMVLIIAILFVCFILRGIPKYCNNFRRFVSNNIKTVIAIILFIISQLYIGSRAEVLLISLALLGYINRFYYKIPFKYILLFGGAGILLFSIITFTRITDVNFTTSGFTDVIMSGWDILISSDNFILLSLTDFIVNSRNLYDGIVYTYHNDLLYGQSYVPYVFSFFPYGATVLTPLLIGKTVAEVNTAFILTKNIDANYGIGTNLIGDIYMNFSLPGVLFMMFLFGLITQKAKQSHSVYGHLLYFSLLANSIYIARASIVAWVDLFVFSVIIYWIIKIISRIKL